MVLRELTLLEIPCLKVGDAAISDHTVQSKLFEELLLDFWRTVYLTEIRLNSPYT